MKNILKALGTAAVVVLASNPAQAASITYYLEDNSASSAPIRVGITLDDALVAGSVTFTVAVAPNATFPNIADLRALYFNVANESLLGGFSFTSVSGGPITDSQQSANNVGNLGGGSTISPYGGFDLGAEIGNSGIGGGDDYQTSVFRVSHNSALLTNASFLPLSFSADSLFAVRAMSVGLPGSERTGSAKVICEAAASTQASPLCEPYDPPCEVDCDPGDVPEPTSMALLGVALLGAGFARRRQR